MKIQGNAQYSGFASSAQALLISKILEQNTAKSSARKGHRPVLAIVPNSRAAEGLCSDLRFFHPKSSQSTAPNSIKPSPIKIYSGWEVLPFEPLSPAATVSAERLDCMKRLHCGEPILMVATVAALMQLVIRPNELEQLTLRVRVGDELDREAFLLTLNRGGYIRRSLVEEIGQLAVRGAVLDFFPPGTMYPVRIELFGDTIESIRRFDPASQRSLHSCEEFSVTPVRELFVSEGSAGEVLASLRERASELSISVSERESIEDAILTGSSYPGIEHFQALLTDSLCPIWEYASDWGAVIVCDEAAVLAESDDYQQLIAERSRKAEAEGHLHPEPKQAYLSSDRFSNWLADVATHHFNPVELLGSSLQLDNATIEGYTPKELELFSNDRLHTELQKSRSRELPFAPLATEINRRLAEGLDVLLAVANPKRLSRIQELLSHYGIDSLEFESGLPEWFEMRRGIKSQPRVYLIQGVLSSGFRALQHGIFLISDKELFPEISHRAVAPSAKSVRRFIGSVSQLSEDDFVVHLDYGIGVYRGLQQVKVEGKIGDFLQLEYADNAKLFVPVENIGRVQKYSGAEGKVPKLTKLGGKVWEKAKKKVQKNIAELAGQLLKVMASREVVKGFSFGEPDGSDSDFAASFEFEETPDQSAAIEAVLDDMSKSRPMDRLVCGDVGYGKTEVALRAAFKAANAGKQTAILVPTTVLAEQHYKTFAERFADTAINVACVSRFYSTNENKTTLAAVAEGRVDIIIGTHRIIQKDVSFKDLGLMIIDEEHRFGVAHKEKLKRMRSEVDVLTLTATPIPRTLHMSLSGIRDLSLIETPPVNRQVIRTYLANYEESVVREAILREIGRNGQVFYIHNRVKNIAMVADELADLVPEARVIVGHGQMKDRELENVMHKFIGHEADVLVSTTIVESGLDISNANTIIIRSADKFGLAELYQLRGRVGRSARRAYAYLLVPDPKTLGPDAKKRLQVLQSLDDLGIGFRLALQDMEIRGAGNLLGKDQSGQINSVGYELYSRILKDAVEQLKKLREQEEQGKAGVPDVDPEVSIGFPAHIPPVYIPDISERLILYQRLIELRSEKEGEEIRHEIEDRFGGLPDDVHILVDLMVLRGIAKNYGIASVRYRKPVLSFSFHPDLELDTEMLLKRVLDSNGKYKLSPAMVISLSLEGLDVDRPSVLKNAIVASLKELGVSDS